MISISEDLSGANYFSQHIIFHIPLVQVLFFEAYLVSFPLLSFHLSEDKESMKDKCEGSKDRSNKDTKVR